MTHIYPCHSCPLREGCQQREEFRQRAREARCTSIRFRCAILAGELRPGRRIVVKGGVFDGWDDLDWLDVKATVTRVIGCKFNCTVDPYQIDGVDDGGEPHRFRRTRPHSRIVRFLDEPDAQVCSKGCVVRDGFCDRGESFMTLDNDFDEIKDGLCACNRQQWMTHRKQDAA